MGYIKFDRKLLVNLEYSLGKELIRANRRGSFASTTIVGCNTRKYHGLLITKQPEIDNDHHVLLSSFDETVIQRGEAFNLGIHQYDDNIYHPRGHKYITDFETDPIPRITYEVGGVVLTKARLFSQEDDRIMIKYELVSAHSPTKLRFTPFLAYRNFHGLSKANNYADMSWQKIQNGIRVRMYEGYSYLFLQFSKKITYVHQPDWYYNIQYIHEKLRGYDFREDLYVPGWFEVEIGKGESIIFSAGLHEVNPSLLRKKYEQEINGRIPRSSFTNCLINAAQQFVIRQGNATEIIAGYPWFGSIGRDTFVSLPGITLSQPDTKTFFAVLDTMVSRMLGPFFPNVCEGKKCIYNAVDAPLWFAWALQQYVLQYGRKKWIWEKYGAVLKNILSGYRAGTDFGVHMTDDGLLHAGIEGAAVTWMDAFAGGRALTPRTGLAVEINALWYNAVCFCLSLAQEAKDKDFISLWLEVAAKIPAAFTAVFWSDKKGYLADFVRGEEKDWSVRPNQVFAASLPHSPVTEEIRGRILDCIGRELLTPRGLRTLSPKSPDYKGTYCGDQASRELAYHHGTVFPWLMGAYVEGYLRLHGKAGLAHAKKLLAGFESTMTEHGIGTLSEIYDGDPPHHPRGGSSHAWSVSEVLRMSMLISQYENQ